ncbi:MAG: ABC transporter permease [Deltaproteobacteria bacterium]|nr:ABC transporter permease [Deltaproteobacteria bacterium]
MIRQLIKLIWNRRRSNAFIILEILATFLVLSGVTTFGLHYWHRFRQPLGFSYENVWSIIAYEEGVEYGSKDRVETLQQIERALKDFREVKAIGQTEYNFYAFGHNNTRFRYQGRYLNSRSINITDGCAGVLQPDLIQGRWFDSSDDDSEHPPVIINKRFGDALIGRENPLGKILEVVSSNEVIEALTVVGVVSDFRLYGEYDGLRPFVLYRTTLTNPDNMPYYPLLIRVDPSAAESLMAKMLTKLQWMAPTWTFRITPVAMIRDEKLKEGLAGFFSLGIVAFFLTLLVALGLTGVLWQNVTRRTREIGLRRAAGAPVLRIFQQIAGEMILITTTAVILGIIFILHLLLLDIAAYFRGQSYIWGTAIAVVIIYFLTLVCTLYPGYMAIRIHPAEALHYD